jgi:hypothetical protein
LITRIGQQFAGRIVGVDRNADVARDFITVIFDLAHVPGVSRGVGEAVDPG